jgi:hypothetical protein
MQDDLVAFGVLADGHPAEARLYHIAKLGVFRPRGLNGRIDIL